MVPDKEKSLYQITLSSEGGCEIINVKKMKF